MATEGVEMRDKRGRYYTALGSEKTMVALGRFAEGLCYELVQVGLGAPWL